MRYKKYVSGERGRIALLLTFLLMATLIALLPRGARSEFASSELRFSELSEKGLQIVPASCPSVPSNPDYPHDTCGGGSEPEQPQPVLVAGSCLVNQPFSLSISSPNSEFEDSVGLFGKFYSTFGGFGDHSKGSTLAGVFLGTFAPFAFAQGAGDGVVTGTYVSSAVDTTINFPSADTPIGINRAGTSNYFGAEWVGYVKADYSEDYTFYTTSDDGVYLTVNGNVLVNNWTNHGATEDSGTIALTAGEWYPIRLAYYEFNSSSRIELRYSSPSVSKQIIPSTNLSYSNGPVYYTVNWDDGSSLQRVPTSGTVNPSETQVAYHSYSSGQDYTAEVRATAANGAESLWERTTFTCTVPSCTPTTFCSGDNLWYRDDVCVESFIEACAYGCAGNACSTTPISVVDIQVGSALVRQGNTVTITWSAENVASCVVTEDNPDISDSWSCSGSACTWQTQTSSPIPSRTTYSLVCTGLDDQTYSDTVLVDVIPVFEEI